MRFAFLLIISFLALFGGESLPSESEIRELLRNGKRPEVVKLVERITPTDSSDDPTWDFLLSTVIVAGSYSRSIDKNDFMLVQLASDKIIAQGIITLSQQAILINYLSSNYRFFTRDGLTKFPELRRMAASTLAVIIANANEAALKIPEAKYPTTLQPPLSQGLLKLFQDNGITYISGALPRGENFKGEIREKYNNEVQLYIDQANNARIRDAAMRILSEGYLKPPMNYFTTQYSRHPYDYKECNTFLVKAGLNEKLRKKVICDIALAIQIAPPQELNCNCNLKVGADEGF